MSTKSRIVLVAGSASHGSGSHEHPGGCSLLADLLNKHVDDVEAIVIQGWPTEQSIFKDTAAIAIYSDGGGGHLILPPRPSIRIDQIRNRFGYDALRGRSAQRKTR